MKNKENLIVLFIIKMYILYTMQYTGHLNLTFFVFLSSFSKFTIVYRESVNLIGSFTVFYLLIDNSCE